MKSLLCFVTGGKEQELGAVLSSFFALFLLMGSYYLVRPLRKGFFTRDFAADDQAWFSIGVILLLLLLSWILSSLYDRVGKEKIARLWFAICAISFILFGLALQSDVKWIVGAFCIWSSVYFPLTLAFLWGSLNRCFDRGQSKRVYGFIILGATTGALFGLKVITPAIGFENWQWILYTNSVLMLASLALIEWVKKGFDRKEPEGSSPGKESEESFLTKLAQLCKNRYLLSVAVIMFGLAFGRQVFELQSQKVVENEISRSAYHQVFPELQGKMGFEVFRDLKNKNSQVRAQEIEKLINTHPDLLGENTTLASFSKRYESFRTQMLHGSRKYVDKVWTVQNMLCIAFLLIFKSSVIQWLGVRTILLLLPLCYFLVFTFLAAHPALELLMILHILILTFDYSLNNLGKELLYVPLSSEANLRFKPMIEGPIFKLGGAGAALGKVVVDTTLIQIGLAAFTSAGLLALGIMVTAYWIRKVLLVSSAEFQTRSFAA